MRTIAIIGGGAAGMMTAATLLERNDFSGNMLLFEKNSKLGAKVLISGGGRCNVTTGVFKRQELKTYYTRGGEFLDTAFRQFGPRQVRAWFESHGVPLKKEEDGRIFPISDDGKDVVGVFEQFFAHSDRIQINFGEGVEEIQKNNDGTFAVVTEKGSYTFDVVVLTTGGNAYAHTGSSGDGYTFARACGHTITSLGPSLNSFMTQETWTHPLSGLSFPDALAHITLSTGEQKQARGPILLTHFGISGPATFVVASYTAFEEITPEQPLKMHIQPLADQGYEQWMQMLLEISMQHPKKELATILGTHVPKRFVLALLGELALQASQKIGTLTRDQRVLLSRTLGAGLPLHAIKRRPGDEFVTAGGVSLDEIDPATMQSIICPGLYFAGEIMDVDGVTGGFNLQASWAAGRLAGKSI